MRVTELLISFFFVFLFLVFVCAHFIYSAVPVPSHFVSPFRIHCVTVSDKRHAHAFHSSPISLVLFFRLPQHRRILISLHDRDKRIRAEQDCLGSGQIHGVHNMCNCNK